MATTTLADDALRRLAVRVGRALRARGARLATAESCTGGWIAKVITDIPGSSDWFEEALVTYGNLAKQRRLGVAARVLARHGAVSDAVVRAMARGALRHSAADCAVAVSGIAGPGGAVPGKPVGTVWIGWAWRRGRGLQVASACCRFRGDRETVRRKTVRRALQGLVPR
jgi:nicotinamide-nucleotide amidase